MAGRCDCSCSEVCDFCFFYDFNGEAGVYVGDGVCWHPEHPFCECEPGGGCSDFHCRLRKPTGKTARELTEDALRDRKG